MQRIHDSEERSGHTPPPPYALVDNLTRNNNQAQSQQYHSQNPYPAAVIPSEADFRLAQKLQDEEYAQWMVYINDWNEYQQAVEQLYLNSPKETRYVTSWLHSQGQLVLKVTDNFRVLKYKTDQAADLKKFERLNKSMILKMQNRKEPSESEVAPSTTTTLQTQVLENITSTPEIISHPQPISKKKGKKGR
ncbi:10514_t:CDS:2 [Diversispora eburnea]|uniref:10514_t:CDS:1 n=1 Tax=Diversispora eburnea TaxID=1213867 RepID=A0A9N9BEH2_9GLOM|nr:10514_t:CDS:2 [Diversispora eburnea]